MSEALQILSVGAGTLLAIVVAAVFVFWFIEDVTQKKHAVLRNYPVIGRLRYFFEKQGEYFRQYFFAGDREEMPFNRATRAWVYRVAKKEDGSGLIGFGSTYDMKAPGAILFVNGPATDEIDRLIPFQMDAEPGSLGIVAVSVSQTVGQRIAGMGGGDLARWQREIDGSLEPRSRVVTDAVVNLRADLKPRTRTTHNVIGIVEGHPQFARFEELQEKIEALDTQKMDLERTGVKCQRLIRALENVALAANLPQVATPEQIERYARLRAAEAAFFGPPGETPAGEAVPVSAAP